MRSFFIWLFKDIIWDNIFWIGLVGVAILVLLFVIGLFLPETDEGAIEGGSSGDSSTDAGGAGWNASDTTDLMPTAQIISSKIEDSEESDDWFNSEDWEA